MMTTLYLVFFVILGLIFGSFLNVVGLRLPKGEPFANERSGCPKCGHQLKFYELVPVLSYVAQSGKCRGCKTKISPQYPLVELVTGLLFGLSYWYFGLTLEFGLALLLVSMLVILFVSDIHYMLIPDKVLLFFTPPLAALAFWLADVWWYPLAGALIGGGVIFLIIALSRGGMGAGDMKLFLLLGLVFGPSLTLFTLAVSFIVGGVVGGVLFLLGKIKRGTPFPFGPFIIGAAVLALFYGTGFVEWYVGFL